MLRALPLLLLALTLTACDSGDSGGPEELPPPDLGAFHATVSFDGGDRLDLSGFASSATAPLFVLDSLFVPGDSLGVPDSTSSFTISLTAFDPSQPQNEQTIRTISLTRFDGERPGVGTYPLSGFDRSGFIAYFASFDRAGGTVLSAETGTLTIDVSTETRTAGSFTFRGSYAPLEGGDARTATVMGRFDARFSDLGGPFVPLP